MGRDFKLSHLHMDAQVIDKISERLSTVGGLYLPNSIRDRRDQLSPSDIKTCLHDLLHRDAALFLERYGPKLNAGELEEFEILKHDYEISWHLKQLKTALNPTLKEKRSQVIAIKNRRLAYMDKLIHEGQYFSEDAMRERAPFLHHEYVGKFQDPHTRGFSRPGERWSETLMRQSEEATIVQRIREEQQRLGITEELPEQQQEEEEEEEEEEDDEDSSSDKDANNEQNTSRTAKEEQSQQHDTVQNISDEEMQEGMENFTRVMKEKFLSGEDSEYVDYSYIDNNVALDDHWWKEITQDAEDKYFEED